MLQKGYFEGKWPFLKILIIWCSVQNMKKSSKFHMQLFFMHIKRYTCWLEFFGTFLKMGTSGARSINSVCALRQLAENSLLELQ